MGAVIGGTLRLSPYPPPAPADGSTADVDGGTTAHWYEQYGDSPSAAAKALVRDHLSYDEKAGLLLGFGAQRTVTATSGHYVGNIHGVARLGLPSQNAHDAGQGFNTKWPGMVGQVTAFPSALSAAATWDATLVYRYAAAIGEEFKAKGANVLLGPSINVHRVFKNGRNGEYLSGEDGMLGAPLAAAFVRGVQSVGVAAIAKHFVLNSQETNRGSQSSDASDRTLFEVYYPPFAAAVKAGCAGIMCGYNKVNGSFVCGNADRVVVDHLRGKMGFEGFVMTDWWALHSSDAANHGIDQEQPGTQMNGAGGFFSAANLQRVGADVDAMARRVLTGMLQSGAFDIGSPRRPTCTTGVDCEFLLYQVNAATSEHAKIAREVAASSAVLLKNEKHTLPMKRGAKVALLGSACDAGFLSANTRQWDAGDYYTIGGSGRVLSYGTSIKAGLEARRRSGDGSVGRITHIAWDDVEAAANAMAGHDLAIACGGAAAAEATDRWSLQLDQDEFLRGLAARAADMRRQMPNSLPPLVIVALAPGAILAEWAADAQAALVMFLPGQEAGNALADVVLGDVNPSGRLPLTLPKAASQGVAPCLEANCEYTEGLHVGWKALVHEPVAFCFGHGMSYSTFEHTWAQGEPPRGFAASGGAKETDEVLALRVQVRNTGSVAGAEVVQVYLAYPPSAGEPPLVLRDYRKTEVLAPGGVAVLHFSLTPHSLSIWSEAGNGGWRVVKGTFTVLVGASSRNTSLSHRFESTE